MKIINNPKRQSDFNQIKEDLKKVSYKDLMLFKHLAEMAYCNEMIRKKQARDKAA